MRACSTAKDKQCQAWRNSLIILVVMLAAMTITMHLEHWDRWDIYTKIVLGTATVVSTAWCIWVMHTFRNIIGWWKEMHHNMDEAVRLLNESKQDISEIKQLSKPQV